MPGSLTVLRRRWETFALVIAVAPSPTSLRCGSRPNSGQSSRRAAVACAAAGAAGAPALAVELSAGALFPQAALSGQRSAMHADALSKRTRTPRC